MAMVFGLCLVFTFLDTVFKRPNFPSVFANPCFSVLFSIFLLSGKFQELPDLLQLQCGFLWNSPRVSCVLLIMDAMILIVRNWFRIYALSTSGSTATNKQK